MEELATWQKRNFRRIPRLSTCTFCSVHQIDYPEIAEGIGPRHRFMSAYEQRIEPPDRRWQYLLLAAEPYETIAFKVSESCTSVVLFIYNSFFPAVLWTKHLCSFRSRVEKLIKQKIASGPTGTEKPNRYWSAFLTQSQTVHLIRERRGVVWPVFVIFPPSSSFSSTSKWRKLLLSPAVHHLLQVWSAPLLSWAESDLAHQMILFPLPLQEGCLSPLSHPVPQVPPTCPLRCPCPPCQWGHLHLRASQYLIIDPLPAFHDRLLSWCTVTLPCRSTVSPF